MAFPPIVVGQPQPNDLVDHPVQVSAIGTVFEAVLGARVLDADVAELKQVSFRAGTMGAWGNFQTRLELPNTLATARGRVEVWGSSGSGRPIGKVVVPIIFGTALISPYAGFAQYAVQGGYSLSTIAGQDCGGQDHWRPMFEAKRNQISDPDLIFAGHVLRVPQ